MKPIIITFLGRSIAVEAPAGLQEDVARFFALATGGASGGERLVVAEAGDGYAIEFAGKRTSAATKGEALHRLSVLVGETIGLEGSGVLLRAGAVGWGERAILVAARPGGGASSLVAWLIEAGFAYVADDSVVLSEGAAAGFAGPLNLQHGAAVHVAALGAFRDAAAVRAGDRLLISPDPTWLSAGAAMRPGLIVFVAFERGAPLAIDALPPPQATWRLLEATRKVVLPNEPGFAPVAEVAAKTPALMVRYGDYAQLGGVVDFLARTLVDAEPEPADVARFLKGFSRPPPTPPAPAKFKVPERTNRQLARRMTIGMATYDDYDGVYFSLQAIRMYHGEIADEIELLVVDNHPDGKCSAALKALENYLPNYRYVPAGDVNGTAIRDRVFTEAGGTFVLCMDCHVFVVPGALRRLLDQFAADPETDDLLQGPLISDDLVRLSTHMAPAWRDGMYGTWAHDPRGDDPDGKPFEIPMQGLGLFACRRAAWPGFNPRFQGFGGEEGYIHEKVRQGGGRTLCLPYLRWMHRFQRPMGVPYPNRWEDRFRNYLIGFHELALPTADLEAHMREKMGDAAAAKLIEAVERELGIAAAVPVDAG